MAAKTPKQWKDTKENEVGDWLRWLMAKSSLANDQSGAVCVMPRASFLRYDTELSLFTKTQTKKTHACQIYFHHNNFYLTVNP